MDTTYLATGTKTLSAICRELNCSKDSVILASQTKTIVNEAGREVSLSSYLLSLDLSGRVIPEGTLIYIRQTNSGGLEQLMAKYNVSRYRKMMNSLGKDFNCYMYTMLNGSANSAWDIPVYPNEFADSNSGNFSSVSLLGRSVDYQIYQSSSRDVSFTLQLHEELCNDYNYIHRLVAQFESACYPGYSGGIVQVPEIFVSIGNQFKIRGILTSCSAAWKAPIINGRLINCDLSLSIKETAGPYTQSEVAGMGGRRG